MKLNIATNLFLALIFIPFLSYADLKVSLSFDYEIEELLMEAIDKEVSYTDEDDISWSGHEFESVELISYEKALEIDALGDETVGVLFEIGMGNELDESVVYGLTCETSLEQTENQWSVTSVECEEDHNR